MRRPVWLLVALLALGSACGGNEGDANPAGSEACVAPTPASDTSAIGKLPLDLWGTVMLVQTKRGFVGAQAISEMQIVELYPQIVRDLGEAGYVSLGGENEGFEAELAFSAPNGTFVSFALRETDCDEQILIRVLIEKGPSEGKGGNG